MKRYSTEKPAQRNYPRQTIMPSMAAWHSPRRAAGPLPPGLRLLSTPCTMGIFPAHPDGRQHMRPQLLHSEAHLRYGFPSVIAGRVGGRVRLCRGEAETYEGGAVGDGAEGVHCDLSFVVSDLRDEVACEMGMSTRRARGKIYTRLSTVTSCCLPMHVTARATRCRGYSRAGNCGLAYELMGPQLS